MSEVKSITVSGTKLMLKDETARANVVAVNERVDGLEDEISVVNTHLSSIDKSISNGYSIFLGDSYAEGWTPEGTNESWLPKVIRFLGLGDTKCYKFFRGGYGFVSGGTTSNFLSLLQEYDSGITDKSLIKNIYVVGGYNDRNASITNINTGISNFCAYVKANYPNAKIYIGHVGWNILADQTDRENLRANSIFTYSKCMQYGANYLVGTENILHHGSYFGSDGFHPNSGGQLNLAVGIANAIRCGSCDTLIPKESLPINLLNGWLGVNTFMSCSLTNDVLQLGANDVNLTQTTYTPFNGGVWYTIGSLVSYLSVSGSAKALVPVIVYMQDTDNKFYATTAMLRVYNSELQIQHNLMASDGSGFVILNVKSLHIMPAVNTIPLYS